jgi:hypothetical protein
MLLADMTTELGKVRHWIDAMPRAEFAAGL